MLRFHNNDSNHCYWCKKSEQINSNITQYTYTANESIYREYEWLDSNKKQEILNAVKEKRFEKRHFVVIAVYISILTD